MSFKQEIAGAIAISAVLGGVAASQVISHRDVHHITIEVHGDRDHTLPHTITLESVRPYTPDGGSEPTRIWSASRVSERGSDHVTASECPAVDEVVTAFRDMPRPAPVVSRGGTIPIEPTMKDGFETRLIVLSEGVNTAVDGHSYQVWGHQVVSKLLACWEPLIPDTSSRYWERRGAP
ncbi:MAG: hypothetical protein ACT6RD_02880 [Brevundimonas sp.]|uniref:hypothetical protein n=1 Tax=Brevundimonas sp. TaxID=1871086 RepID=UPI004034DF4E